MKKWFRAKSGNWVIKRKAAIKHRCISCSNIIDINLEYYQVRNPNSWNTTAICEKCWKGQEMSARNPKKYNYY